MGSVQKSIDVEVPVRTAYNQWTQFESFPKFMDNVESVQQIDDTHLRWKAKMGGKTEEWNAVITEQTPDQRIAWRSTSGAENAGVVSFHKLDNNTARVTLQMEFQPDSMTEKVGDFLGVPERQVEGDLKNFKKFIEERGTATGAWRGEVDQDTAR